MLKIICFLRANGREMNCLIGNDRDVEPCVVPLAVTWIVPWVVPCFFIQFVASVWMYSWRWSNVVAFLRTVCVRFGFNFLMSGMTLCLK